jgi:hypothetical protein
MMAMFKKEFRDVVRWAPLAIALGLAMLWMNLPSDINAGVQAEDTLVEQLGFAAAIIATAFGLLQSLFDVKNDSRGYLLHRPLNHQQVYWAKVAAGFAVYLMSLSVPVVLAAIYLSWKGIEKLPTSGMQVLPFSLFSLVVFLLHPTALWIANRDARWVGSRMLPAVGVAAGLMMIFAMYSSTRYQGDVLVGLALIAVITPVLVLLVVLASRHAFSAQSYLPPQSSSKHRCVADIIGLTLSAVVLYGFVGAFAIESIPKHRGNYIVYRLTLDQDGQWKQLRETHNYQNWNAVNYATADLGSETKFEATY